MITRNFLGIPIEGMIHEAYQRPPQRPLADLRPLLVALLDDDHIIEFGWTQYTPYFMDGEECIFRAGEFWVRTAADGDTHPDGLKLDRWSKPHPSLGGTLRAAGADPVYLGDDEPRYRRAKTLADALDSHEFDEVLMEAFGDHARIVVRRGGIEVEYHEHD